MPRSFLAGICSHRERFVLQGLQDEVADHPAVFVVHPRPVRVEDASDGDAYVAALPVGEGQRLGDSFSLVIAGAGTCESTARTVTSEPRQRTQVTNTGKLGNACFIFYGAYL